MTTSRRDFLTKGTALIGAAGLAGIGLSQGGCALPGDEGTAQKGAEVAKYPLDPFKMDGLVNYADQREDFMAIVDETVDAMMEDPELRATFMENCDASLLLRLYEEHVDELEPYVGRLDARTARGRTKRIVVAAEMFQGVHGPDFTDWGDAVDVDGTGAETAGWCCNYLNGCCITHFWGWASGQQCC